MPPSSSVKRRTPTHIGYGRLNAWLRATDKIYTTYETSANISHRILGVIQQRGLEPGWGFVGLLANRCVFTMKLWAFVFLCYKGYNRRRASQQTAALPWHIHFLFPSGSILITKPVIYGEPIFCGFHSHRGKMKLFEARTPGVRGCCSVEN